MGASQEWNNEEQNQMQTLTVPLPVGICKLQHLQAADHQKRAPCGGVLASITGNRPELDKPELDGLSGSQFPSTRMENFLPTVPNGGTAQPQPSPDFPSTTQAAPDGGRTPQHRGQNPIKAALRSKPGDQVLHLPPPPKRKISNQGIPVGKYTLVSARSRFCHSPETSQRSDKTKPDQHRFILLLRLFFLLLFLISFRWTTFIFIVFISVLILLFLSAWGFAKMAAPMLQCISQGRWFGT
eukprot:bmy_17815T0